MFKMSRAGFRKFFRKLGRGIVKVGKGALGLAGKIAKPALRIIGKAGGAIGAAAGSIIPGLGTAAGAAAGTAAQGIASRINDAIGN